MPLAQCVRCKKMFNKVNLPVCPKCEPKEQEDFDKIQELLAKEPGLNAEEVAEKTDVDIECVLRCVSSGLVTIVKQSETIKCGRCGAPAISLSKKLCQNCLNKLNEELAKQQSKIHIPKKKKEVQIGTALNLDKKEIKKARSLQFRNR